MKKLLKLSFNRLSFSSVFFLSLVFSLTFTFTQTALALTVPTLSGPVVDQAHSLDPYQIQDIEQIIRNFKSQHQSQIQVLILENLEETPIEQAAIQVFDQWKLGDAKRDDGLLIIVGLTERKIRIEVGQGLEGSVSDLVAKRIISDVTRPLMQAGSFYLGLKLTVMAAQNAILTGESGGVFNTEDFLKSAQSDSALSRSESKSLSAYQNQNTGKKKIPMGFILIGFAILWFILFLISPSTALWILYALLSGSRGGGRGGFGGGGGWSGGGGSSSGGGASGDW